MRHLPKQNRDPEISRSRRVVEHVLRYRITTNAALHRHEFPQLTLNAVSKMAVRYCQSGVLAKHPLFPPSVYFTLGRTAARERGLPLHRTQPLGPQALPIEYGVLAYAALGTGHHLRLTCVELEQLLPGAPPSLIDSPFCLDQTNSILELLRVDLGGGADHVARKCAAVLRMRRAEPVFEPWLKQRRLRLVIVTSTADKAAAIRTAVNQHLWPDGLSIHLAVVSQLLLLTGRI